MSDNEESTSERMTGPIEPASAGFVCQVVHAAEVGAERLSLQESALTPTGKDTAVARRFKLGRIAAHRCLTQFGESAASWSPGILRGGGGQPIFPRDYVGSISHTGETATAVVGRTAEFLGIGVDIERADRPLQSGIIDRIGIAQERSWIKANPRERALMVFCAKESIYKALFPLHEKRMEFKDVALTWEEEHGAFVSTLLTDFGAPWDAGATLLTLCRKTEGFIVAVTIIEHPEETPAES